MRWTWMTVLVMAASAGGGCAGKPDWPNPQRMAADATGVSGAMELRMEGEPDDVEPPIEGRLTMAAAIERSLKHDPGVQIALAKVRVALAEAEQSRLLPNPVLSVVLRWPEGGGSGPTIEAGLAADLVSVLRQPGEIEAADHRLRAAGAEAVTAALDVLAQTQRRMIEVQYHEALTPVFEQRRELLDRLVTLARQRLEAGEGTRLDVTTLEAQRVVLQIELAEHQIERGEARLSLARLIGRPSDESAWDVEPWVMPQASAASESQWVRSALTHRPEIQAAVWRLEALGADARLTRWALFEGLEGGVEGEREDGHWTVGPGATVPLPIFDWGQARRAAAAAALLEAAHELTAVKRGVIEEVRRSHLLHTRLREATAQVREELIPLLQRRLTEAEAALRGGQSDMLALIVAEQELQAGRIQLIELERRTAESWIDLHRAAGGPGRAPAAAFDEAPAPHPSSENPS